MSAWAVSSVCFLYFVLRSKKEETIRILVIFILFIQCFGSDNKYTKYSKVSYEVFWKEQRPKQRFQGSAFCNRWCAKRGACGRAAVTGITCHPRQVEWFWRGETTRRAQEMVPKVTVCKELRGRPHFAESEPSRRPIRNLYGISRLPPSGRLAPDDAKGSHRMCPRAVCRDFSPPHYRRAPSVAFRAFPCNSTAFFARLS